MNERVKVGDVYLELPKGSLTKIKSNPELQQRIAGKPEVSEHAEQPRIHDCLGVPILSSVEATPKRNIYSPPKSDVAENAPSNSTRRLQGMQIVVKAPPLIRFNGIGFGLFGRSNVETDGSYITTYFFTVFFLPLFPLARYCVVKIGHGRYQFLATVPLRLRDKVYLTVAGLAVGILGAMAVAHR